MDADLVERWRARQQPFDGLTLELPWPGVALATLRGGFRSVLDVLAANDMSATLETFEDWHEHDGYVKPGTVCDREDVYRALESDESFLTLWPGDTFVRRSYAPPSRAWYLRIWFEDDEELDPANRPTRGGFDVTCSQGIADSLTSVIPGLEWHLAGEFFDSRWAG